MSNVLAAREKLFKGCQLFDVVIFTHSLSIIKFENARHPSLLLWVVVKRPTDVIVSKHIVIRNLKAEIMVWKIEREKGAHLGNLEDFKGIS